MEPTKQFIDEMYRERVEAARRMSPEDKLLAGARLFELSAKIMADGIRAEFPDADERRVQAILRQRLDLIRRRENNPQ